MERRTLGGGATPVGDAAFDQLAALIDRMIEERLARVQARLAEVTAAPAGADARVSVRVWDDDGDGQERIARTAGVRLAQGDTVVVLPVGADESYVVVSKVIHRAQDRAVVGGDELTAGAVTEAALAADAVTQGKIADSAVGTAQIADGAVTPIKLSRAYATPGDVSTAVASGVSGLATTAYVNQQVGTRAPAPPEGERGYATKKYVDDAVDAGGGGKVSDADVVVHGDNRLETDLNSYFRNLASFMVCVNNNLKGGKRKPCSAYLNLFD